MTQMQPPTMPSPAGGSRYPMTPPPPPRGTNTLAILSLVLAFVVAPVAAVLGFVALGKIKRTGEGGKGLAVAGIVLGVVFTLVGIAAVLFVVLATPTRTTDNIETQIATTTEQTVGVAPTGVQCPDSVDVQVGATFTCTAGVDGQNLTYLVTQKDDAGNVGIVSQGFVSTAAAAKAVDDEATKNAGVPVTTTCADGAKVVVGGPGTTFGCTIAAESDPTITEEATVTITSDAGDVSISSGG
ncbi:uncharacterized protein DUF4333 [Pseudonocardia sediminis]|uniref:Uncharacterized protein DUF4333 n=1 Tax=Pseudonocardia sediminis TaxID=1397368 RepID=A0A4Q7V223_PSEST|nr:DUF4333 domain-containing protein [Pseudonocardia sediminis]RZT86663.1 uncharacterized protein DUF4333 [Pseudonocardia sediminis]